MRANRVFRNFLFVFPIFLFVSILAGQSLPSRDPNAVSILTSCLNSAGILTAQPIGDFTATGTITFSWAGKSVSGLAIIQSKGTDQYRMDIALSSGVRTWLANHGTSTVIEADGSSSTTILDNTLNLGTFTYPLVNVVFLLSDPSVSVRSLGSTSVGGRSAFRIRLARNSNSGLHSGSALSQSTLDVFVDAQTYSLLQAEDVVYPNATQPYVHDLYFSNYQPINGILVPMLVSENVANQATWTISIQSIAFNAGVPDSAFQL
jgi:hypothetical protein